MSEKWPIGVFTSVDAGLGVLLDVAHELGVRSAHLHTPHAESRTPEKAAELEKRLRDLGIAISVVFAGFDGESYADIPTTARTVGLMPRETRAARVVELKSISDFAAVLGVDVVGVHIGFVPHDTHDPEYAALLATTRDVCGHLKRNGQSLHLETGQEPVDVLIRFLDDVGVDNLFVNFDPANLILYGVGEPLPDLEKLGSRVRSVHCKDAIRSDKPGETWGHEVPLGDGDVDFAAFLKVLKKIGYDGPLTIEREIPREPDRQKAEIGRAIGLLQQLKQDVL